MSRYCVEQHRARAQAPRPGSPRQADHRPPARGDVVRARADGGFMRRGARTFQPGASAGRASSECRCTRSGAPRAGGGAQARGAAAIRRARSFVRCSPPASRLSRAGRMHARSGSTSASHAPAAGISPRQRLNTAISAGWTETRRLSDFFNCASKAVSIAPHEARRTRRRRRGAERPGLGALAVHTQKMMAHVRGFLGCARQRAAPRHERITHERIGKDDADTCARQLERLQRLQRGIGALPGSAPNSGSHRSALRHEARLESARHACDATAADSCERAGAQETKVTRLISCSVVSPWRTASNAASRRKRVPLRARRFLQLAQRRAAA